MSNPHDGDRANIFEHLESLAALSAIGAATDEEQAQLQDLQAQFPQSIDVRRDFDNAAATLAHVLPPAEPPAHALDAIRQRIGMMQAAQGIQAVRGTGQGPAERDAEPSAATKGGADIIDLDKRRRRRFGIVTTLAAATAIAAMALGVLWTQERQHSETWRQRAVQAEAALGSERRQTVALRQELDNAQIALSTSEKRIGLVRSPSVQLATLRTPAPETTPPAPGSPRAKVFIDPDNRRWLVLAYDLPQIDPSKQDYQLWFIPRIEGAAPMPAGLLTPGKDGVFETEITIPDELDIAHAAISLEKKGGVDVPTDVKMLGPIL